MYWRSPHAAHPWVLAIGRNAFAVVASLRTAGTARLVLAIHASRAGPPRVHTVSFVACDSPMSRRSHGSCSPCLVTARSRASRPRPRRRYRDSSRRTTLIDVAVCFIFSIGCGGFDSKPCPVSSRHSTPSGALPSATPEATAFPSGVRQLRRFRLETKHPRLATGPSPRGKAASAPRWDSPPRVDTWGPHAMLRRMSTDPPAETKTAAAAAVSCPQPGRCGSSRDRRVSCRAWRSPPPGPPP